MPTGGALTDSGWEWISTSWTQTCQLRQDIWFSSVGWLILITTLVWGEDKHISKIISHLWLHWIIYYVLFTCSGVRPFGVSLLICGWNEGRPYLFQSDPSVSILHLSVLLLWYNTCNFACAYGILSVVRIIIQS